MRGEILGSRRLSIGQENENPGRGLLRFDFESHHTAASAYSPHASPLDFEQSLAKQGGIEYGLEGLHDQSPVGESRDQPQGIGTRLETLTKAKLSSRRKAELFYGRSAKDIDGFEMDQPRKAKGGDLRRHGVTALADRNRVLGRGTHESGSNSIVELVRWHGVVARHHEQAHVDAVFVQTIDPGDDPFALHWTGADRLTKGKRRIAVDQDDDPALSRDPSRRSQERP
jgi:hypothetical protein